MSKALFFADTTVISNFALIGQMDLLKELVNGNGAWCATVASECDAGSCKPGLESMSRAGDIFGEPLYATAAEHVEILALQDQMMRPGDHRAAHLGEAETITLINSRGLSAAFVTDDKDAQRHARNTGIPAYNTWDILRLAVATKKLTVDLFIAAYAILVDGQRGHPPCERGEIAVTAWVTGGR